MNKDKALSKVPLKPGIYMFKNKDGEILYIGKAINLLSRVRSYFSNTPSSSKLKALVPQIERIETIQVESELEALILEANLIKKFLPPFNVRLTDDKDYLYIKVTKEDFPKVATARKNELAGSKVYFGPFPSSRRVKETLKSLRKLFPWCSNPPKKMHSYRSCFYYHLGLCPGPCVGKISKDDYKKIIKRLILLLDGKKQKLLAELTKDMQKSSMIQEFEKAQKLKNIIAGLNYLTQSNKLEIYLENPNYLEDIRLKSLEELKKVLSLPTFPERIEGYDISNLQGKQSSGSMVVLDNGEIDKSQYRKFKINKGETKGEKTNDYGSHQEMMKRRLKHLEWNLPDLIIIDGGLGQVRAVKKELDLASLEIPVFGLAKRMEWLYSPNGDIIKLPKNSLPLKLLQRLRDESHRFALKYHHNLRAKSFELDLPRKPASY